MTIPRDKKMVDSFVGSMMESIRFFAKGRIPEDEIRNMAEYEVSRLDFNNDWQMHKGLGYFAMNAVNRYLSKKEKTDNEKNPYRRIRTCIGFIPSFFWETDL